MWNQLLLPDPSTAAASSSSSTTPSKWQSLHNGNPPSTATYCSVFARRPASRVLGTERQRRSWLAWPCARILPQEEHERRGRQAAFKGLQVVVKCKNSKGVAQVDKSGSFSVLLAADLVGEDGELK
ncbi:hypothetical protein ABZP36_004970 [Zizania latifolia]